MQPSLKKLQAFFFGKQSPPYTHHLNHKSWILLPLVSVEILSLILVRSLSAPKRENQCPIKKCRYEIGLLAALHRETDLGRSFCHSAIVKPTSTDKGAIPCHLLCCGYVQSSVYNFQETYLKTLPDYSKRETEKVCLSNRPLITRFFLLFLLECHLPAAGSLGYSVHPNSAQCQAPPPCPAKGGRNSTGNTIYTSCLVLQYSRGHASAI